MPDHHLSEDSVTRFAEAFLLVADNPSKWIANESGPLVPFLFQDDL
jgi:hypothetical protein